VCEKERGEKEKEKERGILNNHKQK